MTLFHEHIEQHEDGVSKVTLTLEFQWPPVDMPLKEDFEHEHGIPILQHLPRISLLETLRDPDERSG